MAEFPKPYQRFKDANAAVVRAYEALAEVCGIAGSLDAKSRELIKLGMAIGARLGAPFTPTPAGLVRPAVGRRRSATSWRSRHRRSGSPRPSPPSRGSRMSSAATPRRECAHDLDNDHRRGPPHTRAVTLGDAYF